MVGVIDIALNLVIIVLAVSYIFYITFYHNKHKFNAVRSFKVQILLSSILFVLFIPKTIIASILGRLIALSIICIIILAVITISEFLALKQAKEKQLKAQSANENVIDLESAKKCRMMKKKKDEHYQK